MVVQTTSDALAVMLPSESMIQAINSLLTNLQFTAGSGKYSVRASIFIGRKVRVEFNGISLFGEVRK